MGILHSMFLKLQNARLARVIRLLISGALAKLLQHLSPSAPGQPVQQQGSPLPLRVLAVTAELEPIETLLVPATIAQATVTHLRLAGRAGCEEFAFWSGHPLGGGVAVVTRAFHPNSSHEYGHVTVDDPDQILAMIDVVHEHEELVLCQLHTHPKEAFHSSVDDRGAFTDEPGFLSLVLPTFGSGGLGSAQAYRLTTNGWQPVGCVADNCLLQVFGDVLYYGRDAWQSRGTVLEQSTTLVGGA